MIPRRPPRIPPGPEARAAGRSRAAPRTAPGSGRSSSAVPDSMLSLSRASSEAGTDQAEVGAEIAPNGSGVELVHLQAGRLGRRRPVRLAGQRRAEPQHAPLPGGASQRSTPSAPTLRGEVEDAARVDGGRAGCRPRVECVVVQGRAEARLRARPDAPGRPGYSANSLTRNSLTRRRTGGSLTPAASRGSASSAVPPDRTSRKRRAVTGGNVAVRTGTAAGGQLGDDRPGVAVVARLAGRRAAAARRRSRRGPGRPTVTARRP